jgi:hypothetical protein
MKLYPVIGQQVNFLQSEPEFSSNVTESMLIVQPVPVEIYGALVSVLNDLKYTNKLTYTTCKNVKK